LLSLRFIPVVLFALPLSKLLRLLKMVRAALRRHDPSGHKRRVQSIQEEVRSKNRPGNLLATARSYMLMTSMRIPQYKKKDNSIQIPLFDILELNEKEGYVRVEPQVNMGSLSSFLLPKGFTLPVVPELDELTVGGLIAGYGIETSSHKYGLFFDVCDEVELVLGTGELVTASRTEHSDLFYAIPWSCGALGFIVGIKLRVIRCKPYVNVRYVPCTSREAVIQRFSEESTRENPHEFVEALMYDENNGVVILGDYSAPSPDKRINHLQAYNAEWFYKQVERTLQGGECEELIPTYDWHHRHSTSLFWEMELILPFGNSWLFRNLLGWLMPINLWLLKMANTESLQSYYETKHTAQDFLVPIEKLDESLELSFELFDIFPIWLCPHWVADQPGALRVRKDRPNDMYVDVGLYGVPRKVHRGEPWAASVAVAKMEEWLIQNEGYSALYAMVELSRENFGKMFDREYYERIREKYHCVEHFMDTYDKIRPRNKKGAEAK